MRSFIQRVGGIRDFLFHVAVQQRPFLLRQVRSPVFALCGISRLTDCTISLPVLQALCLLAGRFKCRLQLALHRLGLPLGSAGQFVHDFVNGIPQLLQQRPVSAVLPDKVVQHVAVGDHFTGVVGGGLVQRLFVAGFDTGGVVLLQKDLCGFLHVGDTGHGIPEGPVLLRCQLLYPVGPLMADHLQSRVHCVLCDQNVAAGDLAVCASAQYLIHHPRPQTQCLGHGVYLVGNGTVHFTGNIIVKHKAAVRPGGLGKLRRPFLSCKRRRSVSLSRLIGRVILPRRIRRKGYRAGAVGVLLVGHARVIRPQELPGIGPTVRPLIRRLKRLFAAVPQRVCNAGKGFLHGGFPLPQDLFLHGNGVRPERLVNCRSIRGLRRLYARLRRGGTCTLLNVCALLCTLLCGSQIIAVCVRADDAAHRAGRCAYQEIIQRIRKRFLRRSHIAAVNAGQLPFHPVADELFQALANRSGSESQRRPKRLFTNFRFGKLVYRAADAALHHVIQRTAAVRLCKRQCDVEHLFGENLFCGRSRTI